MNEKFIYAMKFEGGGIAPEKVSLSDLADLIISFENLLLSKALEENPNLNKKDQLISLVSLTHGSLNLGYEISKPDAIVPFCEKVFSDIREKNYSSFSEKGYEAIKRIIVFSSKHNCDLKILKENGNSELLAEIPKGTILTGQSIEIKEKTTVYGYIFSIGGKEPNVHIEMANGRNLICSVSKDQAISLAGRLYSWIGFKGKAKFNIRTKEYSSFIVEEIINYQPGNSIEVLKKLSLKYGKYYQDIKNPQKYIEDIRGTEVEDK